MSFLRRKKMTNLEAVLWVLFVGIAGHITLWLVGEITNNIVTLDPHMISSVAAEKKE